MKGIIKKYVFIGSLLSSIALSAQDIHLSQYTMTPLLQNPSFAGNFGGDIRVILNRRTQWGTLMTNPYVTYGINFDKPFYGKKRKDNFFGGGIMIYSDKAGAGNFGTTIANIAVSYHIKASDKSYLSAGLLIGINQRSVQTNNLRFDNQYDGYGHNAQISSNEVITNTSLLQPAVSSGVSYSWSEKQSNVDGNTGKRYRIGFAVAQINNPDYNFIHPDNTILLDKLALRYTGQVVSSISVGGSNLSIQPGGFITFQRKASEIMLGSNFRYSLQQVSKYTKKLKGVALNIGIHYRVNDAVIPSVLLEIGNLALGVSYDMNNSALSAASNGFGGVEISLRYLSPNPFGGAKTNAQI